MTLKIKHKTDLLKPLTPACALPNDQIEVQLKNIFTNCKIMGGVMVDACVRDSVIVSVRLVNCELFDCDIK